jgi:putative Holliday junction resolvase
VATKGRTLGLDVGEKRIGVAMSDPLDLTAQPLAVVERRGIRVDVEAVLGTAAGHTVIRVVAGLPLEMDGKEGHQAERVRHFCGELAKRTGLEVVYQDERLTTLQSERLLESAGVRSKERRGLLDKMAAALILQSWLDARAARSAPPS